MKNLKLLNKYIIRFLMMIYCIAAGIFTAKLFIYINAHETETNEILERLKLLLLSGVRLIESIDGSYLFALVLFVLVVGMLTLHFIQKILLDNGESINDDDF